MSLRRSPQGRMAGTASGWHLLFPVLLLCAALPETLVSGASPASHIEIVKPLQDLNQYKHLELPNGLRAVVISVPDCDRAAASLAVHAGSHQDPDEAPGTAHLLEHAAFLGSKKYPEKGAFGNFIRVNGGSLNAHTYPTHTTYHFDIPPDLLPEALDRLVQNVAFPLMDEQSVNEEINAVDAEFQYRKTLDSRRLKALLSHVPRLPHLGKFTTGNLDTLLHGLRSKGIEPTQVVKEFHETWYSANLMTLAVAGKGSVEDLEAMIKRVFSVIPNRDKSAPELPKCSAAYLPFPPRTEDTITFVVPVAELHQAIFVFYVPPKQELLDSRPDLFITALLAHDCATCLGAKLKQEGLISSMRVDTADSESCGRIEMVLDLTEKGSRSIERIGEIVFLYLRYMAVWSTGGWRWKELQKIAELAFDYKEQEDPRVLVQDISSNLIFYPPTEALRGNAYLYNFDKQLISSILDTMRLPNARILMVDKVHEPRCKNVLAGYPVVYGEEPVSPSTSLKWREIDQMSSAELAAKVELEKMALPGPNPYIPTDLALLMPPSDASRYPELLAFPPGDPCGNDICKVFYKQDTTFHLPLVAATFVLYWSPISNEPRDSLMLRLLAACVDLLLKQEMAYAKAAGYSVTVKGGLEISSPFLQHLKRPNAIVITAKGYSEKLPQLFQETLALVARCKGQGLWKPVFDLALEGLQKQLRKDLLARNPVRQASDALARLLLSPYVDDAAFAEFVEETALTPQEFEHWLLVESDAAAVAVEGLIEGNIARADAQNMVSNLLGVLKLKTPRPYEDVCSYKVFDLSDVALTLQRTPEWQSYPVGEEQLPIVLRYTVPNTLPRDKQNGVSLYIQMGVSTVRQQALTLLTILWLSEKFFHELRTEQQLGYIVALTRQTLERTRYLLFTVVSAHDVNLVAQRIRDFGMRQAHTPLSQEDFETIQNAGIKLNQVAHKSLSEETEFNSRQVFMREYMFDLKERLAETLRMLTVNDFNMFLVEIMAKHPKLSIRIQAQAADEGAPEAPEETLELRYTPDKWVKISRAVFATS